MCVFTCFLFAEHFDEEYCLSLRLNEQGQVDASLMRRSIDDLRLLQVNARTMLVLPTRMGGLYEVELAWVGDNKARSVLPYALEDNLAEPVTMLHFAFDIKHHQNNRYLVAVIAKQILVDFMDKLSRLQISFDLITLDWFALNPGEVLVIENNLLVNNDTFKGALSIDLFNTFLQTQTVLPPIYVFNDSIPITNTDTLNHINSVSYTWISERLFQKKPINFCQGEFQHNLSQQKTQNWYKLAGFILGVSFAGFILVNVILLMILKNNVAAVDAKIAVVYRQFFPEARQIISPRFRIGQLLNNQSGVNEKVLALLKKLTDATFVNTSNSIGIQHLRFQNQTLFVTLECHDFAELEKLETRLQQENLVVHQTSAVMQSNKVVATLELA